MGEFRILLLFVLASLFIIPLLVEAHAPNLPLAARSHQQFDTFLVDNSCPFHTRVLQSLDIDSQMFDSPYSDHQTSGRAEGSRGTKYVGGVGPGNYSKIQDAINASTPGDIIFVYHGSYRECLLINTDDLTLIGEDWQTTVINGFYYSSVIFTQANGTSIQGFTIRNTSTNIFDDVGIVAVNPRSFLHGIKVAHCIFKNDGRGVYFSNVTDSSITDCQVENLSGTSISILSLSNNITIDHCLIANCGIDMGGVAYSGGIFLFGFKFNSTNLTVSNNIIHDVAADGILLQLTDHVRISNNTIRNCSWWGVCIAGQNTTVHDNSISKSLKNGIMTQASQVVDIRGNRVIGNGKDGIFDGGILIQDSNHNAIMINNSIEQNSPHGLYLIRSPGATIQHNNLINNTCNAFSFDTATAKWRGNYWDDWIGFGPKIIKGWLSKWKLPWLNIDWRPAREPYFLNR
jgi:parallel beta-helix repeat protein